MRNLLKASQVRDADAYTIANEPIASIDLMERASRAFVEKLFRLSIVQKEQPILICCGTGNNGGDGLAIARMLYEQGFSALDIWVLYYNDRQSADFKTNLMRIEALDIKVWSFFPADSLPVVTQDVIIDALLGSGLNKPLAGAWLKAVQHLNQAKKTTVAVDIPTGMLADGQLETSREVLYAQDVITFQRPKISFLFPESARCMERFHVVDIGLDERFIAQQEVDFYEVTTGDVRRIYKNRHPFSHKGTYGHALLVAGSEGTLGAALLCAEACLFAGAGLTSASIPRSGLAALNTRLPEVMTINREALFQQPLNKYHALGIGPGLGTDSEAKGLVSDMIEQFTGPTVVDADALHVLANEKELLDRLSRGTVLTPHMKEFDRLFGQHHTWWARVERAKSEASRRKLVIVLKNRFTFIAVPDGKVYMNFTGNPAMASGGMGDALTGIIVSFLAQGYEPKEAAILGCYIHGKAGDVLNETGMAVIPASILISEVPKVIGWFESRVTIGEE